MLLTREKFKSEVFKRDNNKCVICGKAAVDAHHILDRKLFTWEDEKDGYFLDNGASLCEEHHLDAEKTIISCEEIRKAAKIKKTIYPKHLYSTEFIVDYDKWGNPITKTGRRLKGDDFNKENVQKIIFEKLDVFEEDMHISTIKKYPRTYHFPFSPGTTNDDRISKSIYAILKGETVYSEKLDGENNTFAAHGLFARSRTSETANPWCSWMKPKWEMIKRDLNDFNIMICGENTYGEHSIKYSGLDEHFHTFGIKNTKHDVWLSWEEVEYYSELFDFKTVPVLEKTGKDWIGSEIMIKEKILGMMDEPSVYDNSEFWSTPKEGIVVRTAGEFNDDMFYNHMFKYVRAGHVQTDQHWARNWNRAKLEYELKLQ